MWHTLTHAPQFYVTAPQPCPYLHGRAERKLFTALHLGNAQELNNALSRYAPALANVLYRPSRGAAWPACRRDPVRRLRPQPDAALVRARNADPTRQATSAWATEEQAELFRRYLDGRHADGGMADMDILEFGAAMIEETPVRTRVTEYRGRCSAPKAMPIWPPSARPMCWMTDCRWSTASSTPGWRRRAAWARTSSSTISNWRAKPAARWPGLLGARQPQDDYARLRFGALEIYKGGVWQDIGDPQDHSDEAHPLAVDPIVEQVARIDLP